MTNLFIIQARMGSTRLPGKVLMDLNGKPLVVRLYDELKKNSHNSAVVIATSTNTENDILERELKARNIPIYRGPESDVLQRFVEVIKQYQPEIVIRATADDPLMPAECADLLIEELKNNDADYATIIDMPLGTSVEVFKANALLNLLKNNNLTEEDHEHVTLYLYKNPDKYKILELPSPKKYNYPELSFTIDTLEEYLTIKEIYDKFGDNTNLELAIKYVKEK